MHLSSVFKNPSSRLRLFTILRTLSSTATSSKRVFDFPSYIQHGCPISNASYDPIVERELPNTVTVLSTPKFFQITNSISKCSIYLIGSNHVSIQSQKDIEFTIKNVRPHVIMLELCSKRANILSERLTGERFKKPQKNEGSLPSRLYSTIKNVGKEDGRDFWAAYNAADQSCPIILGDRLGDINNQRLAAVITFTEVFCFAKLYLNWIYNGGLKQEKIDDLLLDKLRNTCPRMWKIWVEERDIYMAFVLQTLVKELMEKEKNGGGWLRIVAVMGMGHVQGVCKNWDSTVVLPPNFMEMPPSSLQAGILKVAWWIGRKGAYILVVIVSVYMFLIYCISEVAEVVVRLGKP